jgi:hypothetical protein
MLAFSTTVFSQSVTELTTQWVNGEITYEEFQHQHDSLMQDQRDAVDVSIDKMRSDLMMYAPDDYQDISRLESEVLKAQGLGNASEYTPAQINVLIVNRWNAHKWKWRAHHVEIGWIREQVRKYVGEPQDISKTDLSETWKWSKSYSDKSPGAESLYLRFHKGVVDYISAEGKDEKWFDGATQEQNHVKNEPKNLSWGEFAGDGLFNRRIITRANVADLANEPCKMVVNICVDRSGKVVNAQFDKTNSTLLDADQTSKAEAYAKQYEFESDSDAPVEQCGRLTFIIQQKN